MEFEDISKIVNANPTNKYIIKHLDDDTIDLIMQIMEKLDANDFKEIAPNSEFDFTDIPIPYDKLKLNIAKKPTYSKEVKETYLDLLKKINTQGTNIEYPLAIRTDKNGQYAAVREFEIGKSQSCQYDWDWIENYIKDCNSQFKMSIVHTHPNPLSNEQHTIFNKYKDELLSLGVKPNGLNISVADIYAEQYLEMLIEKYDKNITAESTILMFNGTLLSFNSKNGLELNQNQKLNENFFKYDDVLINKEKKENMEFIFK